jgi:phosphoenolpyruvate synthase/pyruvate phosphate dikinase
MQDIRKIKWYYFHTRRRSPWYIYLLFQGFAVKTVPMEGFKYWVRHCGTINHQIVMAEDDWNILHDRLWDKLDKEPNFLLKQLNDSYEVHNKFLDFVKKIYKINDFSKYSKKELTELIKEYLDLFFHCGAYGVLPLYIEDDIADEISQKVNSSEYDIIMSPVKNGREVEERISLLKLAVTYKKAPESIKEGLESHWLNFAWLNDSGYYGDYFSKDYYLERIKKQAKLDPGKELQGILDEIEQHQKDFDKVLDKYKKDKRLVLMIATINDAIFFRSFRSEEYYRSGIYLTKLFSEVAHRLGLKDFKELFYFTVPEVLEYLDGGESVDKDLISQRKESFIALSDWDKYIMYQGQESKKISAQIDLQSSDEKELIGQPAFKGVVKGRVAIVRGPQDFDKVEDGDILVAQSTQPNYVPILKKVKAIVTEEGGVLCHASVISRELKVPCVIGTKVATKVLKDGDMVEVDANKGIVKKI